MLFVSFIHFSFYRLVQVLLPHEVSHLMQELIPSILKDVQDDNANDVMKIVAVCDFQQVLASRYATLSLMQRNVRTLITSRVSFWFEPPFLHV